MSKKRAPEVKTTLAEAFIQFQIEMKRKDIEEFNSEINQLEAKNQELIELDKLKEEQTAHIQALCKQAKAQEQTLVQGEVVNKEQVEQAKLHNLELIHSQEEERSELCRKLAGVQAQVAEQQQEREIWLHYKNVGSIQHQQQIQNLQSDLTFQQKIFEEISEKMKRSLEATFAEIDRKTSHQIDAKQQQATERAIKQLDQSIKQEIRENNLFKTELVLCRKEVSLLEAAVWSLEEENLEYMQQHFEHHVNDVQILRNIFFMQATALEQIQPASLEQSVQNLTLAETAEVRSSPLPPPSSKAETGGAQMLQQAAELEKDETDPSCKPSSPPRDLTMLPSGSQTNLREPVNLGPLEQKMLAVVGRTMTLHTSSSDSEDLAKSAHLSLFHLKSSLLPNRLFATGSSKHTS